VSRAEEIPHSSRRTALFLIAIGQLLAMSLWFSASAVAPQLREVWELTTSQEAALTLVVQLGFVVGALISAVLNLADTIPSRRLFLFSALGGAGANRWVPALADQVGWRWAFPILALGPLFGVPAMIRLARSEYRPLLAGGRG